jgi:hypothetical protein
MTSAQRSIIGFGKQTAKGTPQVTDGSFNYLLFTRGAAGVQNMTIPLDMEVGGGAMLREVVKTGVTSGGALEFIPRPQSLGLFLMGALGQDTVTGGVCQVETATVTGSCTGAGNATVIVTAANLLNSPVTYSVALTTGDNTATLVATKIRTALALDLNLVDEYIVGGSGANIALTSKLPQANDAALNISIANGTCTGLTAAPTSVNTTAGSIAGGSAYSHAFTLPTDQFSAPYYTVRYAPGNMWGEQYQDARISMLGLSWRGANFVRGQMAFSGGVPTPNQVTTTWGTSLDNTPPFITPVSTIEMPNGQNMKVLGGSFQSTMAIPLDEQWIVGSYNPDDFDIVSRAYVLQLAVKVTDNALYNKVVYDGLGAVSAWSAEILKEADFNITFNSAQFVTGTTPYSLKIEGNGGAAGSGNVAWSAQPIGLRAGSQVVMSVTGIFLADATQAIKLTLTNGQSAAY